MSLGAVGFILWYYRKLAAATSASCRWRSPSSSPARSGNLIDRLARGYVIDFVAVALVEAARTSTGPPSTWPTRSSWSAWPAHPATGPRRRGGGAAGNEKGAPGVSAVDACSPSSSTSSSRRPGRSPRWCARARCWRSGAPSPSAAAAARRGTARCSWGEALWDDRAWWARSLVAVPGRLASRGLLDETIRLPLHTYGVLLALGLRGRHLAGAAGGRAAGAGSRSRSATSPSGSWSRRWWAPGLLHPRQLERLLRRRRLRGHARSGASRASSPLWEGGLVFYGGFIAAALAAWPSTCAGRRCPSCPRPTPSSRRWPSASSWGGSAASRPAAAGASVADSDLPWLARFPPRVARLPVVGERAEPVPLPRPRPAAHPAAPPDAALRVAGRAGALPFLARLAVRPRKRFHGQVMAAWLMLYAVLRADGETFRGDVERGLVPGPRGRDSGRPSPSSRRASPSGWWGAGAHGPEAATA